MCEPNPWSTHSVHLLQVFRILQCFFLFFIFFPAARPFSMMSESGVPDTIIYYPHSQWTTALKQQASRFPLTILLIQTAAWPSLATPLPSPLRYQSGDCWVRYRHTDNMQQHLALNCLKPHLSKITLCARIILLSYET